MHFQMKNCIKLINVFCKKTFSDASSLADHKRIERCDKPYECDVSKKTYRLRGITAPGEKPYSCEICQKSYKQLSSLSYHNNSVAHINRKQLLNTDSSTTKLNIIIDCGEIIKVEDVKEEINEEEDVDDPLAIHEVSSERESNDIIKEEVIDDDPLYFPEIHNSYDKTVVDDLDIFEHRMIIDI